jgi:hypothetical protein
MTRTRLPNRRAAETFEITAGGLNYRATVGRFDNGQVSELFLSNHKVGPATSGSSPITGTDVGSSMRWIPTICAIASSGRSPG